MDARRKRTRSTSPTPSKVRAVSRMDNEVSSTTKEHMDTDMESQYSEQSGTGGSKKLAVPRPPGIGRLELIFNARMFLTMYVFKPVLGALDVSSLFQLHLALFPCYTFNVGNLGLYCDKAAISRIVALMGGDMLVRVKNISGSLKTIGVTAPFVTEAANQSSTNAQVTATALVGYGLERKTNMLEGTVAISSTSTSVSTFKDTEVYWADSYIPPVNVGGVNKMKAIDTQTASCQFKEYTTVSASYDILDASSSTPSVSAQVNYTKHMTSVDLTESQGEILAWNHEMQNCFLQVVNKYDRYPQLNLAPNFHLEVDEKGGTYLPSVKEGGFHTGHVNGIPAAEQHYLTHNNAAKVGTAGAVHQILPPKAYLQLVPPPTINPTNIQDYFVSTTLDTEIVIEAFGSSTLPNFIEDDYSFIFREKYKGYRNAVADGSHMHYVPHDFSLTA